MLTCLRYHCGRYFHKDASWGTELYVAPWHHHCLQGEVCEFLSKSECSIVRPVASLVPIMNFTSSASLHHRHSWYLAPFPFFGNNRALKEAGKGGHTRSF